MGLSNGQGYVVNYDSFSHGIIKKLLKLESLRGKPELRLPFFPSKSPFDCKQYDAASGDDDHIRLSSDWLSFQNRVISL